MKCFSPLLVTWIFPLFLATSACMGASVPKTYDVVVVSGSSGGFGAALAAGRMGASVALIEDTPVLGGMITNGVSNTDSFSNESLSGIFNEFRANVSDYYQPLKAVNPLFAPAWDAAKFASYGLLHMDGRSHQTTFPIDGGTWEPHVADIVLRKMIAAVPGIHVFYSHYVTGVVMDDKRLTGVVARNIKGEERKFIGKVVIDATHEGDIAAWAGAPYRVGREARSPLEPHAGEIYFLDETGEIMPGSTGRGDRAIPSYGLRLIVKAYTPEEGPAPLLAQPAGYKKENYIQAGCKKNPPISMVNGKFEMNANPIGNELQEINWGWPEADRNERNRLFQVYKNHALGFLYFQQHECGNTSFGLPKDEFVDNDNVPYRVYVREARRIEGEVTLTEADINPFISGRGLIPPMHADSVAIGHYPIDAKPVKSKTDFSRPDKGNGDFFLINASHAFQVPYGAMVPKKIDGLLVPVALSATHVAFSAIRMDPTWMSLGQAAGVAAVQSIREGVSVRDVSVDVLQHELIRQKSRLVFYWDLLPEDPSFSAVQWLSVKKIIGGDAQRNFRPKEALTRSDLAVWTVNGMALSPSVSNAHFSDVPYDHPSFREIETLYDNDLLRNFGILPLWQKAGAFNAVRNIGFTQKHGLAGRFEPDRPVIWKEWAAVLRQAEQLSCGLYDGASSTKANDMPSSDLARWVQQKVNGNEFGKLALEPHIQLDEPVTRGPAATFLAAVLSHPDTAACSKSGQNYSLR